MFWRIKYAFILLIFSASCDPETTREREHFRSAFPQTSTSYLISAEELLKKYRKADYKLIDLRKAEAYQKEHIEGALHIQRKEITDTTLPYGGKMAKKHQLEMIFSGLGIGNEDTLILYDDVGACEAARLWWVLQQYNFTQLKILDGGLDAWKAAGAALSSEIPASEPTDFKLGDFRKRYSASMEEVNRALNGRTLLIDARMHDEYSGARLKKGAFKAGHIPGSIHIDWAENIHYNADRSFRNSDELKALYSNRGIHTKDSIIVYCHSGVRSSHTVFVLTQMLGFENVRNYDGSWIEWSYHDSLPVEMEVEKSDLSEKRP